MSTLPRAMLIDLDDTILSAYGKPDVAWLAVVKFSAEFGALSPQQVANAIAASRRAFWQSAGAEWRLRHEQARREIVRNGFRALCADGVVAALSDELAVRVADRFNAYREEQMFVFPGAHDAIDGLKALGAKLALITN